MGGLVWLLILGLAFYLMMRFGCGAHMVHGHGHSHHDSETPIDPVCGKPVSKEHGYSKAHLGKRYWFCSRDCLDRFDSEPERYSRETQGEG